MYNLENIQDDDDKQIVVRKPIHKQIKYQKIPCTNCGAYVSKKNMYKHKGRCVKKFGHMDAVQDSTLLIKTTVKLCQMMKQIISEGYKDDLCAIMTEDSILMEYGNQMAMENAKKNFPKNRNAIRSRLRSVASFLKVCREMDPTISSISSLFCINKYHLVDAAIKKLGQYDTESGDYKVPSIPMNLGFLLKRCADIVNLRALAENNESLIREVGGWVQFYRNTYHRTMAKPAKNQLRADRRNKDESLPTPSDIQKLSKHLLLSAQKSSAELKAKYSKEAFNTLSKNTLVYIICYNRKRLGEVERLTIDDFNKRRTVSEDSEEYKLLNPIQQKKCKETFIIGMEGKANQDVYIILARQFVNYILLLLRHREEAGIGPNNKYVFGQSKNGHISAYHTLANIAKICGAVNPERLRTTLLRKQVATLIQVMNFTEGDVNNFSKFMGHTLFVHKEFYEQNHDLTMVCKMATLLNAIQENDHQK